MRKFPPAITRWVFLLAPLVAHADNAWVAVGPGGGCVNAVRFLPRDIGGALAISSRSVLRRPTGATSWSEVVRLGGIAGDCPRTYFPFAINPVDGRQVLLARGDSVYRSGDGGATWSVDDRIAGTAAADLVPISAAFSTDGTVAWLGTARGLGFASTTGGATWIPSSAGIPPGGLNSIFQIEAGAGDGRSAYAAWSSASFADRIIGAIYRTDDAGMTWRAVYGSAVSELAASPLVPGILFARRFEDGAFIRSTDGGRTWSAPATDSFSLFAFSPTTPGVAISIDSAGHLRRTDDDGATWAAGGVVPNRRSYDWALDPATPDHMLLGGFRGILSSADGGATWNTASDGIREAQMVSVASGIDGALYASTFDLAGIYRRDASSGEWIGVGMRARAVFGGADLDAGALAGSRITANLLYMARNGIFGRSADGGVTWSDVGNVDPSVLELIWDPTNDQVGFARTAVALRKTVDGGATWTTLEGFTGQPRGLVISEMRPDDLYLVVASNAAGIVWHSADGGSSWSAASTGLPAAGGTAIAAPPGNAGALYVVAAGGLFRSIDAGATWSSVLAPGTAGSVRAVSFDSAAPSLVYVARTGDGVARSVDNGAHWESLRLPLSFGDSTPAWVVPVPGEDGLLVASVLNEGLFEMRLRSELRLVASSQRQTGTLWNVALELTNRGPVSISAARLRANLPEASGEYGTTGTNCSVAARQLTCDVGSLGVNETATAIVTFTPNQAGAWTANATAYESEAVTANYSISPQLSPPPAPRRRGGRLDFFLIAVLFGLVVARTTAPGIRACRGSRARCRAPCGGSSMPVFLETRLPLHPPSG